MLKSATELVVTAMVEDTVQYGFGGRVHYTLVAVVALLRPRHTIEYKDVVIAERQGYALAAWRNHDIILGTQQVELEASENKKTKREDSTGPRHALEVGSVERNK